jgi:hypothetical protein
VAGLHVVYRATHKEARPEGLLHPPNDQRQHDRDQRGGDEECAEGEAKPLPTLAGQAVSRTLGREPRGDRLLGIVASICYDNNVPGADTTG